MKDSQADRKAALKDRPAAPTVRISTGSRLHFGLLDTVEPYGGVGVMIDEPRTEVVVSPSDRFACDRQDAPRLTAIAQRIADRAGLPELPRCGIHVTRRPSAHCGLGSGTQLALATAEAVSRFVGVSLAPAVLATEIARRGQRSAVGVHGFFSGGLVYEGSTGKCDLNPVIDRVELPARWRVGVFRTTRHVEGVSGELEREQFSNLSAADANARADLSRIVVGQMIPAARRCDFASFTQAVGLYNLASGRLFESVQGGPYNGAVVADLIESLSARGASGVGQSSWGPGVFAWFESQAQMEAVSRDLPRGVRVIAATGPRRGPREMEVSDGGSGHPATRSRADHDRHP